MAGGTFIPSNVVVAEARHDVGSEIDCSHTATRFTGREDEVVRAMLTGKQNKLIGYELGITESSVKVHIRNIMRKLGVRNRTEAVIKISEIIQSCVCHDPTLTLSRPCGLKLRIARQVKTQASAQAPETTSSWAKDLTIWITVVFGFIVHNSQAYLVSDSSSVARERTQ